MEKTEGKMETVKRKKRLLFVLLMTETLCLTGCTGKELEQRRFPLALSIDSVQDQVVLTCAWPGEEGGETGESGGGKTENRDVGNGEEGMKEEAGQNEETEEQSGKRLQNTRFLVNEDAITQTAGATIQEAAEAVQALQDKYVDYSQVKAILWGPGLKKEPELTEQVKNWLEKTPAFARNLLVFDQERSGLDLETVQEKSRGQAGAYLENLYENQTLYRNSVRMLQDLLYGE